MSFSASAALHTVLISAGLATPLVWMRSRTTRPPATLWARFDGPPAEIFDEQPEPEYEVVDDLAVLEEPEVIPIPVEPEPFPEPPLPEPLEAVELLAEALRRPPLDPVFAPRDPTPKIAVAGTPASEPAGEPARTGPVELQPLALADHCPRPTYPRRALRLGWQGTVVCTLTIGADGLVHGVFVLQSSGHDLLDETVVRTLRTWRFSPGTRDGVAQEMQLVRRFRFELPS